MAEGLQCDRTLLGRESPPREAFREVFLEFFPRLRSYFHAQGFSLADAEDLSQTALWTVYRSRDQFRGEGSFDGWVYTVARNLARDEWRRRARGRTSEPLDEALPDETPAADAKAADRQDLARTVAACKALPPRMRTCLLLHVQQGLSYKEIADRLSLSTPTVKVQIWTARRRLRDLLE
ncbi:MAG TPA: sigma-70 family RNA polymerase sigma factor [Thermoanaerobaculia bacterium]|nr:sigma-70 family RNA polymerase sigma factor [Thermoanaerobaculia bacterium]